MADQLIELADGIWSIRGTFRTALVLDIGTQSTLIRRPSGRFLLLDAYTLSGAVREQVWALTDGGRAIDAIVNLHPFHTIHVAAVAAALPHAALYGTRRHHQRAPDLRWAPEFTEDEGIRALFADVLSFTVPRGVDFVSANEKLHFASVLAIHAASGTLIVDDTLMWSRWPVLHGLTFHPTLKQVLQPRAGAAAEFRAWVDELIVACADIRQIAVAHIHLPPREPAGVWPERIRAAMAAVQPIVDAHERRHG